MKRILSFVVCMLILVGAFLCAPFTAFAATTDVLPLLQESGDFEYTVLSDNTAEITRYKGYAKTLSIPSTIDGYTVTSIGENAFLDCITLSEVTIPDTVTKIGDGAFMVCEFLEKVTIPDSVTEIGNSAFRYCYSLKDVRLPQKLEKISDEMFWYCFNLEYITIPQQVKSIGRLAFACCDSLKSVEIPDSVTSIDEMAFDMCLEFKDITIPQSVKFIGDKAFNDCKNLEIVTILSIDCTIGESILPLSTKIYGYTNSTAQVYAQTSTNEFIPIYEVVVGDVDKNADINVIDATLIQLHLAQIKPISDERLVCADTSKDGIISITDATLIQYFIAGIIEEF